MPREHALLVMADWGSKFEDTDDWSIDDVIIQGLQIIAGKKITGQQTDDYTHQNSKLCH